MLMLVIDPGDAGGPLRPYLMTPAKPWMNFFCATR